MDDVRLPETAHTSRSWRIHEIAGGFRLADVWRLPTPGSRDDFPRLVELFASLDPFRSSSRAVRALFAIRVKVGELLHWDDRDPGAVAASPIPRDRLPEDLREGPAGPHSATLPYSPLYLTRDEWAAGVVSRTVDGILHLGWVADGTGRYRGQMAVLVKPNGLLGNLYMAAIAPFRHLIVYPRLMREIGREWRAQARDATEKASPPA
jgi:Protein of unknown function (DUF2867)